MSEDSSHCKRPSRDAKQAKRATCPLPLLRVGSLVVAKRASGVCAAGEPGVCYERYRIGERPGWSIIFQPGHYDGFSPEEVALFLHLTGRVAPQVQSYRFINVGQLTRDYRA